MKYKKKPVVIHAIQFTKERWAGRATPDFYEAVKFNDAGEPYIETLEGNLAVSEGDYVICGVKGEFYPCKPDIFEMSYELVKEEKQEGGREN
jgi:hypothetical protein